MSDLTFAALAEANSRRQAEWDEKDELTGEYRGNETAGEIGEALEQLMAGVMLGVAGGNLSNTIKKLARERIGLRGSRASTTDLMFELGDVVICCSLIANMYGFDHGDAVRLKFNETSRKYGFTRHMI